MEKILISVCIGIFETIIIHTLFNKIFEIKENCKKAIFIIDICIGSIIFLMEMADRGMIIIFAATVMALCYGCIFFNGSIYKKVFYSVMYSLIYLAGRLIIDFMHRINGFASETNGMLGISRYADIFFMEIITFLIVLFMIYKNKKTDDCDRYDDTFKIFSIVPVSSVMLLISLYSSEMYEYGVGSSSWMLLLSILLIVISNVIVQSMLESYVSMKYREYEGGIEKIQSEMEHKYYKRVEKSNKEYMELMHNIKQHFAVIGSMTEGNAELEEYLKGINTRLGSVSKVMYSQNQIFNAILSEKKEEAELRGILCEVRIDKGIYTGKVSDIDIIEIIGNVFDNAIEASEKVANKERRKISVHGSMTEGNKFFVISVENYCEIMPKKENGRFVTIKKDKTNHGIGLESINRLTEKNGGYADISVRDNIFKITIFLPIFPKN